MKNLFTANDGIKAYEIVKQNLKDYLEFLTKSKKLILSKNDFSPKLYDLIILDYHMPRADGLEIAQKIQNRFKKHKMQKPFILLLTHDL